MIKWWPENPCRYNWKRNFKVIWIRIYSPKGTSFLVFGCTFNSDCLTTICLSVCLVSVGLTVSVCTYLLALFPVACDQLLGSFSNDDGDGDGDEKRQKSKGLDKQNISSARRSHFFAHFFDIVARLRRTWKCLTSRFAEDVKTNNRFLDIFAFPELRYSSLEFNSRNIHSE